MSLSAPLSKIDKGKYHLVVSEKLEVAQKQIKGYYQKETPSSFNELINKLKEAQRKWLNYLDRWGTKQTKYCIWYDWKKPERKRKNLMRLGVNQKNAYTWSRTRKGGWAIAQSPVLQTTITLKRLAKRGYGSMLDHYQKVSPMLNEPLYTRPVRTVV